MKIPKKIPNYLETFKEIDVFKSYKMAGTACTPKKVIKKLSSKLPPDKVRGHSTTTWTNFDPILTPSPPRVDKCGHSA